MDMKVCLFIFKHNSMKLKKDNTNKIKIDDLEVLVATLSAASRKRSEILLATNARGGCTHIGAGA